MRDFIVAGNWKMNGNAQLVEHFLAGFEKASFPATVKVVICPPAVYIKQLAEEAKAISVGSQNCYFEASGAYTGELSVDILRDVGCEYVLLGHSERRSIFAESDELVSRKVKAVSDAGLLPVLCIGETLEERNNGNYLDIVKNQVVAGLALLDKEALASVVVAYEPVWAIGTGLTATPEQAQEVHLSIRGVLKDLVGQEASQNMSILYGGSVNAATAKELFAQPDIDGGLVGGASLKYDEFIAICSVAAELV